jgi:3-dehydrotetronate 4-kinase
MGIKIGAIADDFTGATDLANNLVRAGMRCLQTIGLPAAGLDLSDVDAIVVALKSRTNPAADAVAQSLAALRALQALGASQIYFKYCSTFDSTEQGNIGPVSEALMQALGCNFTVATPAFPDNGRSIFQGHLFVGDKLLNESGMQDHPLTPMRDANLVRVLQKQCKSQVGLIDYRVVAQGPVAIERKITQLQADGVSLAVVDALSNQDLMTLGSAVKNLPLLTAGSGLAIGLSQNFGLSANAQAQKLPQATGFRAVVSGSCSTATQGQVAQAIAAGWSAFALDPLLVADGESYMEHVLAWARPLLLTGPVLIYSTDSPERVRQVQARFGIAAAGEMMERALARIAQGLLSLGVKQLIVAGGETSGACVKALNITQLRIGPQIAPGVPWCYGGGLHIALKSGNFGGENFFTTAFAMLEAE